MEIKKNYDNGEINVTWEPSKCIHAGLCVKALPTVFKPNERPWVQMQGGTTDQIKAAIDQCPSGALSYKNDDPSADISPPANMTQVTIKENGPMIIDGPCAISYEGEVQDNESKKIALCRCGASEKKPYCDGAHSKIGFTG